LAGANYGVVSRLRSNAAALLTTQEPACAERRAGVSPARDAQRTNNEALAAQGRREDQNTTIVALRDASNPTL